MTENHTEKKTGLKVKSRREYFTLYCYVTDLATINRMFWRYAIPKISYEDPIWVKEDLYEKWLDEPFDYAEWDAASKRIDDKGSIPRSVFDSWSLKPLGCY